MNIRGNVAQRLSSRRKQPEGCEFDPRHSLNYRGSSVVERQNGIPERGSKWRSDVRTIPSVFCTCSSECSSELGRAPDFNPGVAVFESSHVRSAVSERVALVNRGCWLDQLHEVRDLVAMCGIESGECAHTAETNAGEATPERAPGWRLMQVSGGSSTDASVGIVKADHGRWFDSIRPLLINQGDVAQCRALGRKSRRRVVRLPLSPPPTYNSVGRVVGLSTRKVGGSNPLAWVRL